MIFILFIAIASADVFVSKQQQCVVECAEQQIGKPYVRGGNGPDIFDSAGLVYYCYQQCGYTFEHRPTTKTLVLMGTAVPKNELAKADLVFPNADNVQIYLGNNTVINAPKNADYLQEIKLNKHWKSRRLIVPSAGELARATYVTVKASSVNIRSSASSKSSSVGTYYKGESFAYDKVTKNSECTWLSYIGASSGKRRYVCGKTSGGTCYVAPCP